MTRQEIVKILTIIKCSYPNFYKGQTELEAKQTVMTWEIMLKDYQAPLIEAAVKALVLTLKFPPTIADIVEKVKLITTNPEDELTEQQAWNLISKAIKNSAYGAREEFDKLPKEIQQLVGSPGQLKEWSQMEVKDVQTVVASNFMRSYKVTAAKRKEYEALPNDVKQLIAQTTKQLETRVEAIE
jgi:hypothetical protein